MASPFISTSPHQVRTIEEAQVLIDEAYAQEISCRRIQKLSEIRVKEAIAEACLAYKKLVDAELHTGKVFYVVKASGFQAPNPNLAQPPVVVQISGGMEGSKYLRWIRGLITFNSTSLCVYPREWDYGSHPRLSALTVLLYSLKLNTLFKFPHFILDISFSVCFQ